MELDYSYFEDNMFFYTLNKGKENNLLDSRFEHADNPDPKTTTLKYLNNNLENQQANISVYFRDIEETIVKEINKHDVVFGCVAWLTNANILDALSKVSCNIVVQKEDFLRPDLLHKGQLRNKYSKLTPILGLHRELGWGDHSYGNEIYPIRCAGVVNKTGKVFPKMHNKFIILGKYDIPSKKDILSQAREEAKQFCVTKKEFYLNEKLKLEYKTFTRYIKERLKSRRKDLYWYYEDYPPFTIEKVITGSFNFSYNGTKSLENIIVIEDILVVSAYFEEFKLIMHISEPLDWNVEYVAPNNRIGS